MRTSIYRNVITGITALSIAVFAAGCGSDDDNSSTTNDTSSNSAVNPFAGDSQDEDAATEDSSITSQEPEAEDEDTDAQASDNGDALETYVANVEEQSREMLDSLGGVYSDIQIKAVPPSTIEYEYTFAQQVPAEESKASLEAQGDTLQSMCDSSVISEMERQGISNPGVTFTYLNADGSDLWSYTCE